MKVFNCFHIKSSIIDAWKSPKYSSVSNPRISNREINQSFAINEGVELVPLIFKEKIKLSFMKIFLPSMNDMIKQKLAITRCFIA